MESIIKLAKGKKLTEEDIQIINDKHNTLLKEPDDIDNSFLDICEKNHHSCKDCPIYQLNGNRTVGHPDVPMNTPYCDTFLSGSKMKSFVLNSIVSNKLGEF